MHDATVFADLFAYNDRANQQVFEAAGRLPDEALDRALDIGLGSLRRILIHIHNGELVWLRRWQGQVETAWPSEAGRDAPGDVLRRLASLRVERDGFLARLDASRLSALQAYRDSRGSLFRATLREMILQGFVHSTHHRAQAVNAVRRLGGEPPELDFMVSVRRPAEPR